MRVRLLVGTRKGAFVLTSDGKRGNWEIAGPHFAGWELFHLKGSPVDPNRLYASQCSGWFGQMIQRSNDGGKTWEAARLGDAASGNVVSILFSGNNIQIKTSDDQLWLSSDGGKTWTMQ